MSESDAERDIEPVRKSRKRRAESKKGRRGGKLGSSQEKRS
jgi:hypothetical protein